MDIFYNKKSMCLVILSLLLITFNASATPDYQREKRWESELVPGLIVGKPIHLMQKNRHQFLTLFSEVKNKKMAVVVAHGMGLHPDWGMISTLRQQLYDEGFTTLSIQMPVLAADASYTEYPALFSDAAERLKIAVNFLKRKGYQRVVIVSHSNGSRMSRVYMETNPADVTAWASLSLTQGDTYEGIDAPVLDLYGENDLPHVTNTAHQRKKTMAKNKLSKQIIIPDANHFFSNREEDMVKAVKIFLDEINNEKDNIHDRIVSLMEQPTVTCGVGW